jgi:hypothetical protein
MPTFTHGKNAAFKIDDSGGTLRDISDVLTDVSISRTADVAEVSAFTNSSKAYVAGLKDATLQSQALLMQLLMVTYLEYLEQRDLLSSIQLELQEEILKHQEKQ